MAVLDQCDKEYSSKRVSERGPEQKAAEVVHVDALPGKRAAENLDCSQNHVMQTGEADRGRNEPDNDDLADRISPRRDEPRQEPHQPAGEDGTQENGEPGMVNQVMGDVPKARGSMTPSVGPIKTASPRKAAAPSRLEA